MDKESTSRLGLDYISNIDVELSDELYNNPLLIIS